MIKCNIKRKVLENVIFLNKYGMNDLTWEKKTAKNLILSLMEDEIGILGESVYKIDSTHLIPMYDNWSCNPNAKETNLQFILRSKIEAFKYIDKYPVLLKEKILFSIVFIEDIE